MFDMGESEPDLVSLLLWATNKVVFVPDHVSEELRTSLRQLGWSRLLVSKTTDE